MAKIVNNLHIFRNCRKSQVISMKITSDMSNNLIDTNILGNWVTSIKTRSNMAKILDNLHIFSNFRKSGHGMKIRSNMSNNLIDINILGNKVTSMKLGQIWPKF